MVNLSITARYLAGLHAYSDDYIKSEASVIVTQLYEESFSGRLPSFLLHTTLIRCLQGRTARR